MGHDRDDRKKPAGPTGDRRGQRIDILKHWGLIEADFQREYGIDLGTAIDTMTYRRFYILLAGLSVDSALHLTIRHEQKDAPGQPVYIDEIMM